MRSVLLAHVVSFAPAINGAVAFGTNFRAGAGKSEIKVTPEMLPIESYTLVRDQAGVRVLLMDDGKSRFAIVVIETPSISDGVISVAKDALKQAANVPVENAMVFATHSTSAPHIGVGNPGGDAPRTGDPGRPDAGGNGALGGGPDQIGLGRPGGQGGRGNPGGMFGGRGASLYAKAYQAAVEEAVRQATSSLQPAKFGFGVGATNINVNRDMPTPKGYAEGSNSAGFSDRTLPVVRIDKMDGNPLALLINPAVRSVVLDGSKGKDDGKALSGDLSAATSRYIEKWYGGDTVALFIMGAAVDQAPMLMAAQKMLNHDGSVAPVDIHEAGSVLLDMLGARLGSDAIQASESVKESVPSTIEIERKTLRVPSQENSFGPGPGVTKGGGPNTDRGVGPNARPSGDGGNAPNSAAVLSYSFRQGPDVDLSVVIMRIGDIAIVRHCARALFQHRCANKGTITLPQHHGRYHGGWQREVYGR